MDTGLRVVDPTFCLCPWHLNSYLQTLLLSGAPSVAAPLLTLCPLPCLGASCGPMQAVLSPLPSTGSGASPLVPDTDPPTLAWL